MAVDSQDADEGAQLVWGEPTTRKRRAPLRLLTAHAAGREVGSVRVGLGGVADEDNPVVRLDYIEVDDAFRGEGLSLAMLEMVSETYPGTRIAGGPLQADEAPGPRLRQRAWDAGVQIHDPHCKPDQPCECRHRIDREVRRRSVRREWALWAHSWLVTAERQSERARDGDDPDAQGEASLCVLALHNAATGAQLVLGKGAKAVQEFRQQSALKDIRDMLSHFDQYLAGQGNLQWEGPSDVADYKSPWMVLMAGDPTRVVIMTRTASKGDQTMFEVELEGTLREVAALVAAALREVGIKAPSPTIETILSQTADDDLTT